MTQPQQIWTIASVVKWATDDFRARGIDNPRLDAEVLLAFALGMTRTQLIVDAQRPLSPDELGRFRDLVKRRRAYEPVAYLKGEREFYGRAFRVDRRVLIPRPDTETLVDVALERTRDVSMSMRALDLCTGSGCVAITLARERPTGFVIGTDLSAEAVEVARDNAQRLGAYNINIRVGDLFESVTGMTFDVITANPPYIPSAEIASLQPDIREHEPRVALDGGASGTSITETIAMRAREYLVPGGALAVEVGAGQAAAVEAIFARAGFSDVRRAVDYAKIERVVHGVLSR
jgi:release factor glutamine methyltransferase